MSDDDRDEYLRRLADRLFTLNDELARMGQDEDAEVYVAKSRTLYRLKEEYRRLAGLYPNLPPGLRS